MSLFFQYNFVGAIILPFLSGFALVVLSKRWLVASLLLHLCCREGVCVLLIPVNVCVFVGGGGGGRVG